MNFINKFTVSVNESLTRIEGFDVVNGIQTTQGGFAMSTDTAKAMIEIIQSTIAQDEAKRSVRQ